MLNIIKKIFHCSTLLKRDSGIFSNEFCKTFSRMHFAEHLRASSDRRSYLSTLVGLPPLCYLPYWKRFRDHEKCFLFHLQSSFRSQDISFFVMTFWSCRKKDLIRKIRLTSKCMTSQPGWQTITIHILPNISRSKGNQTMKLTELIKYNERNIFLQKLCRKWGRETSSTTLFIF